MTLKVGWVNRNFVDAPEEVKALREVNEGIPYGIERDAMDDLPGLMRMQLESDDFWLAPDGTVFKVQDELTSAMDNVDTMDKPPHMPYSIWAATNKPDDMSNEQWDILCKKWETFNATLSYLWLQRWVPEHNTPYEDAMADHRIESLPLYETMSPEEEDLLIQMIEDELETLPGVTRRKIKVMNQNDRLWEDIDSERQRCELLRDTSERREKMRQKRYNSKRDHTQVLADKVITAGKSMPEGKNRQAMRKLYYILEQKPGADELELLETVVDCMNKVPSRRLHLLKKEVRKVVSAYISEFPEDICISTLSSLNQAAITYLKGCNS